MERKEFGGLENFKYFPDDKSPWDEKGRGSKMLGKSHL